MSKKNTHSTKKRVSLPSTPKLKWKKWVGIVVISTIIVLLSIGMIIFIHWMTSEELLMDLPDYPYEIKKSAVLPKDQKTNDQAGWYQVKQENFQISLPPQWNVLWSKEDQLDFFHRFWNYGFNAMTPPKVDRYLVLSSPDYKGAPSQDHQMYYFMAGQEIEIQRGLPVSAATVKDVTEKDYAYFELPSSSTGNSDKTGKLHFFDIHGVPAVENMDTRRYILIIKNHIPYMIFFSYRSQPGQDEEELKGLFERTVSNISFQGE